MLQVLGKVAPESVLYRPPYSAAGGTPSAHGTPGALYGPGGENGWYCGPEEGLLLAYVELLLDEEIPLEQVTSSPLITHPLKKHPLMTHPIIIHNLT